MIRILHVIDHLGLGGAQSALLDMVAHRDPGAFEVQVACMHGFGPFAEALEAKGIRVHSLAASKFGGAYLPAFARLLAREHFDILHFHLQGANWLAKPLAAALAPGIPRVAHDHASGDIRFRGFASLLPDACCHFASDRVIAVSNGVRDFLIRWEAVPGDRIVVIPNGIDTGQFHVPSRQARLEARRQLGLPEAAFVVGALGRLAPEKNFASLAAVAAALPGTWFVIGGEGPCEAEIRSAIETAGVGDRVILPGLIRDRCRFYSALDAFVIPSFFEGLPMVLLEAMAVGLPLVVSDLPDMRAALGEGGITVAPGNDAGFSSALGELAANPERAQALGGSARLRVDKHYSAKATASRIGDLHTELSVGARAV